MPRDSTTFSDTALRILLVEEEGGVDVRPVHQLLADVQANPFELERVSLPVARQRRLGGDDVDVAVLHSNRPEMPGLRSFQDVVVGSRDVPVKVLTSSDGGLASVKALQEGRRNCLVTGRGLEARDLRFRFSRALRRARRRKAQRAARAVRGEMRLAREIQQKLFPAAPHLKGFDIGGASFPAASTGGDYFDFLALPDGALGVVIGDVSGHGFGPALLMASTRAYLRGLAQTYSDPTRILTEANRALIDDTAGEYYVTLMFARLDLRKRSLVYVSAGHPTGHIIDPSGKVKARLESTAIPLGLYPHADFPSSEQIDLAPGDLVLMMTDGILEARGPSGAFGEERALDLLRVYRADSASRLVDNLYHAVRAFTLNRPQLDDITGVVIKT